MTRDLRNLFALLAVAVTISSCRVGSSAQSVETTTNPHYKVARLFAVDGCIVYRFRDHGDYHYFVRCGIEAETATAHLRSDGEKTWTEYTQIPTLMPRSE